MTAIKTSSAFQTSYVLTSEAKKRLVFLIEVFEKHTQTTTNNVIKEASFYRAINGKVKVDKQIEFSDTGCIIKSADTRKSCKVIKPSYSVLSIYFFEPESVKEIYSDSKEQMLALRKKGPKTYELVIPDGDNVLYYYNEKGLCSKVVVSKTFYTLEFVLKKVS